MPRYASTDIAHTASTDHRIVRRPEGMAPPSSGGSIREPQLVLFHPRGSDANPVEDDRDLGIALARILPPMASRWYGPPTRLSRQALRLLTKTVENDPDDVKALEARAELLALLDRHEDALEAWEAVLSKYPRRELALLGAAVEAQNLHEFSAALTYWRRVVTENPWEAKYRESLANLLGRQGKWAEGIEHAQACLRLDPASVEARALLVGFHIAMRNKPAARDEFAKIERLRPPNLQSLRQQFASQLELR
jgi:tetratricopeptide (TPR) repeat protein